MKLGDLAVVIRSKNAGPFLITIDAFFDDDDTYEVVRSSGAITAASVAEAYGLDPSEVTGPFWDQQARGMKVTFVKDVPAGKPGCRDVFGAHQHVPLADVEIG
jgi:hypothetical protein